jgi:hypothetical protein
MPPRRLSPTERHALGLWLRSFLPYQQRWIAETATIALCEKSRQIGFSHTNAGAAVFQALLTGSTEIILSASQDLSNEVLDKAKAHARTLARFGLAAARDTDTDSSRIIAWPHGGRVIALPANPKTARSYTGNVWLDEFAYHDDPEKIWDAAAAVAIRGNRRVRIVSTANGAGGLFYNWATHPPAGWSKHRVTVHDAIREGCAVSLAKCLQLAGGSARRFAQWFECSYLHPGEGFFDEPALDAGDRLVRDPLPLAALPEALQALVRTYGAETLRIWTPPAPGAEYVIGGDPSGGGGGDFAGATIRDRRTFEHVATLRAQLKPNPFGHALIALGYAYHTALLAPERNNHGAATTAVLETEGYPNVYTAPDKKLGHNTNPATRPATLGDYEEGVRDGSFTTPDAQLAAERRSFVIGPDGKPRAAAGCFDDLVMADAIGCHAATAPRRGWSADETYSL